MIFGIKNTRPILFLLAAVSCTNFVDGQQMVYVTGDECVDLWTGVQDEGLREEVVGQVCTTVVDSEVKLEVTVTKPGCLIEETHICNLPYVSPFEMYTQSYTILIPELEAYDIVCGFDETSYIVAGHAQLSCTEETTGRALQEGDPDEELVRSYWESPLSCEETIVAGTDEAGFRIPTEDPANPLSQCETAWAYVYDNNSCYPHRLANEEENCATCFLNIHEGGEYRQFNRWGWTLGAFDDHNQYYDEYNIPHTDDYHMEIWAAAGQCDRDKGTLVGELTLDYHSVPGEVTVTFLMNEVHGLIETHLYVGGDKLPMQGNKHTVAPGQFPYLHEGLDFASIDSYTLSGFTGPIYLAAHAVVCPLSANV